MTKAKYIFVTGGVVSSLIFGYLVESVGNYDAVLVSMAGMLILGAGLWLRIDATETLSSRHFTKTHP